MAEGCLGGSETPGEEAERQHLATEVGQFHGLVEGHACKQQEMKHSFGAAVNGEGLGDLPGIRGVHAAHVLPESDLKAAITSGILSLRLCTL